MDEDNTVGVLVGVALLVGLLAIVLAFGIALILNASGHL
jgi:hypothetical protein